MLGAIAGDIIGSTREVFNTKRKDFELFPPCSHPSDDSVLTVAIADAILHGMDYGIMLQRYFWRYPLAGYGRKFTWWALTGSRQPYNSWGNGSAMRVSPVGWAYDTLDAVLAEAERTAAVTHNHPEGIKGAQAVASAIFLARSGHDKAAIRAYLERAFGYDLQRSLAAIRPTYRLHVSCQQSVPEAIVAFLEAQGFEDAIRNAVSLGGDSDTLACMAGSMAEAFYGGVPAAIAERVWARLDRRQTRIVREFRARYVADSGS